MSDYKSMYYKLVGKVEVSVSLSASILRSASESIKSISSRNAETVSGITSAFARVTEAYVKTIDDLTEANANSLKDICQVIDAAADSFTEINENLLEESSENENDSE